MPIDLIKSRASSQIPGRAFKPRPVDTGAASQAQFQSAALGFSVDLFNVMNKAAVSSAQANMNRDVFNFQEEFQERLKDTNDSIDVFNLIEEYDQKWDSGWEKIKGDNAKRLNPFAREAFEMDLAGREVNIYAGVRDNLRTAITQKSQQTFENEFYEQLQVDPEVAMGRLTSDLGKVLADESFPAMFRAGEAARQKKNENEFESKFIQIATNVSENALAKGMSMSEANAQGYEAAEKWASSPQVASVYGIQETQPIINNAKARIRSAEERARQQKEELVSETTRFSWKSVFDGTADIDQIRDGFVDNNISKPNFDAMMSYMQEGQRKVSDLKARALVLRAIKDKNVNAITESEAEDVLYKNARLLTASDNNRFQEDIISTGDAAESRLEREAYSKMTELVRDRDPLTGFFSDNENQILGESQGIVELSDWVASQKQKGKDPTDRDVLIKATEIGLRIKREVKELEEQPKTREQASGLFGMIKKKVPLKQKESPIVRAQDPPANFEDIWSQLNIADRNAVKDQIDAGVNPQEILQFLRSKLE